MIGLYALENRWEVRTVTVQAAIDPFLRWEEVKEMGWSSLVWLLVILILALAARAKKIGVVSIGKNEWGLLEILGFPTIPIPFGLWPFVKGIFHVKQVSTAPTRIAVPSRREVGSRVLLVVVTVFVQVTTSYQGSWLQRFLQLRRDLIAAIYGVLDENIDDAENPERITQTSDVLETAMRKILKESESVVDDITKIRLDEICGDELRKCFGSYINRVKIREDAPVDGQLWKEGRATAEEVPPLAG